MNLSQSPASHGPELTTSTATSTAACRRVFRRKNALRLPGDRTEQPPMPEDFACLAGTDRPTAAAVPSLHADALLPRICGPEGYASANARPFLWDALSAKLYDIERLLFDAHDTATGQAAAFVRLARELENAGEVRHA